MIRSVILGTGSYLPAKVLTNEDLTRLVDTSDDWIVQRTGIRERHIAADGELTSDLATAAAANALMCDRRLDPCMSEVFPWAEIPKAHTLMLRNQHKPGNMAVLVQAPRTGLRTFEDALEAGPRA